MSKERSTADYINDITTAIRKIERFTKNLSYSDFIKDDKTFDAVVRNLEIIGEATNTITKILVNKQDNIPLHEVISMRNKLIHEYFGVDPEVVWRTIKDDLPVFKKGVKEFLKQ